MVQRYAHAILLALLALPLVVAAPGAVTAQITADDFAAREFTDSRGLTLRYRLFFPPAYDPQRRYPLVTFLHGRGARGDDNRRQVKSGAKVWAQAENQARYPAFVLAPQCPGNDGWGRPEGHPGYGPSSPIQALAELLDALQVELSIDSDRLYLTGQSGGGWGTLRLLTMHPDRFAAAILVCPAGEEPPPGAEVVMERLRRLPLWFFHGTADRVVPISLTRQRIAELEAAGSSPRFTEYPGVGHDAWERAYGEEEIVDWLFSHRRPTPREVPFESTDQNKID